MHNSITNDPKTMLYIYRQDGKINIPKLYLNRYLRLTPVLAFSILIYVKLLPYFGDGPLWGQTLFDDYSICERNWYLTLLYVQNYFWDKVCYPTSPP